VKLCKKCLAQIRGGAAITKRQLDVLKAIHSMESEKGYTPSLEEIGSTLGMSSVGTVHKHLSKLQAKGMLTRKFYHSRSASITKIGLARLARLGA
jgi:repressor LexA